MRCNRSSQGGQCARRRDRENVDDVLLWQQHEQSACQTIQLDGPNECSRCDCVRVAMCGSGFRAKIFILR